MPDQRLLLLSVWVSAGFGVVASVWGVLSGSSMIVFSGLYSFASVGLSLLAVLALRFARRGADDRFPWGRQAAEPIALVVKAVALGALSAYAAVQGVLDLLQGGRQVAFGWAFVYAALGTVGVLAVGLFLRRRAHSDLVRAEAAAWLGDAWLSALLLVGFLIALVLVHTGRPQLAAYVDPVMVVLGSLTFLRVPGLLVVQGMRELLAMSPPEAVILRLREIVAQVQQEHDLDDAVVRATKVGGRIDIDVMYVVGEQSLVRTVRDCDQVRVELAERLAALGYERALTVSFTADRRFAL